MILFTHDERERLTRRGNGPLKAGTGRRKPQQVRVQDSWKPLGAERHTKHRKRGDGETSRKGTAGTSGIGVRRCMGLGNHGGPERYRPITTGNNIFYEDDMSKIIKSVHKLVTEGKMSAKSIATAVHKPYSTLLRETNPYAPGAKLGVETFMDIIKATGDTRPLELMVHELGYRLTPVE